MFDNVGLKSTIYSEQAPSSAFLLKKLLLLVFLYCKNIKIQVSVVLLILLIVTHRSHVCLMVISPAARLSHFSSPVTSPISSWILGVLFRVTFCTFPILT